MSHFVCWVKTEVSCFALSDTIQILKKENIILMLQTVFQSNQCSQNPNPIFKHFWPLFYIKLHSLKSCFPQFMQFALAMEFNLFYRCCWWLLSLLLYLNLLQDVWESYSSHVGEWLYTTVCSWYLCEGSGQTNSIA